MNLEVAAGKGLLLRNERRPAEKQQKEEYRSQRELELGLMRIQVKERVCEESEMKTSERFGQLKRSFTDGSQGWYKREKTRGIIVVR
jgi:hypothetical protein